MRRCRPWILYNGSGEAAGRGLPGRMVGRRASLPVCGTPAPSAVPHRVRVDAILAAPGNVGQRRDLGRLDLAAPAPEDVRVPDLDARRGQVLVDGGLMGKHGGLVRTVGHRHDVDVAELGT